jgi:hypothetical protein
MKSFSKPYFAPLINKNILHFCLQILHKVLSGYRHQEVLSGKNLFLLYLTCLMPLMINQ